MTPRTATALGKLLAEHFSLDGALADVVANHWSPQGRNLIGEYRPRHRQGRLRQPRRAMLVDAGLLKSAVAYDDAVKLIQPE